ncbi:golgin subfamily A member 6-like protein 6 [Adelges cooleyi]|uniref:golgin subfamily A member 6-like protein 6 n=1 Tax=Adelges cooleyi TaxID=133065 RepID=UPI00217F6BC7|nr:golgin subfamily A member 6-like protein 6 [Adelges cooleyi]
MQIAYVGGRRCPGNRVQLVSAEEWKRLTGMSTRRTDEKAAAEDSFLLKETRRAVAKKLADSWENTVLNKTKKILEQKRTAKAKLEAEQKQRDEEIKIEALNIRNEMIEKSRKQKFEQRDWTKTFIRAHKLSEVFGERDIQFKLNESERLRKMEQDMAATDQHNMMMDAYKKEQLDQQLKTIELKKTKTEELLKELKHREEARRDQDMNSYNDGRAELQKLARELAEVEDKARSEAKAAREKAQKYLADNRKLVTYHNEKCWSDEYEEDLVTVIMAETKKRIAKMRMAKEVQLRTSKALALDGIKSKALVKRPSEKNCWSESDQQKAIEEQEKTYQKEQWRIKEAAKKRNEEMENGRRMVEEAKLREQVELMMICQEEMKRSEKKERLWSEYDKCRSKAQVDKMIKFREDLDKQCRAKETSHSVDIQDDVQRSDWYEKLCQTENEEFISYALTVIEKSKQSGKPIVPLLRSVNDFLKKYNLSIDEENKKVFKNKPKAFVRSSRVIAACLSDNKETN